MSKMQRVQAFLVVASFAVSFVGAQTLKKQPTFNGKWQRVGSSSDNAWEKIQIALGRNVLERVEESTSSGPYSHPSLLSSSPDQDELRRRLLRFASILERLEVELVRNEVRLNFGGYQKETYTTDGESRRRSLPDGLRLTSTANWIDGQLVLEHFGDSGAHLVETYTLLEDGQILEYLFRLESEHLTKELSIRSVYRRAGRN